MHLSCSNILHQLYLLTLRPNQLCIMHCLTMFCLLKWLFYSLRHLHKMPTKLLNMHLIDFMHTMQEQLYYWQLVPTMYQRSQAGQLLFCYRNNSRPMSIRLCQVQQQRSLYWMYRRLCCCGWSVPRVSKQLSILLLWEFDGMCIVWRWLLSRHVHLYQVHCHQLRQLLSLCLHLYRMRWRALSQWRKVLKLFRIKLSGLQLLWKMHQMLLWVHLDEWLHLSAVWR